MLHVSKGTENVGDTNKYVVQQLYTPLTAQDWPGFEPSSLDNQYVEENVFFYRVYNSWPAVLSQSVSIGKYVARCATNFPMDTQPANRIWLPTQPRHYTTREKIPLSHQLLKMGTRWPETCWATYKEQLIRRNKYNTKWHLVGFLFHMQQCMSEAWTSYQFLPKKKKILRCRVLNLDYWKVT